MRRAATIARLVLVEALRRKDAYVLGLLMAGLLVALLSADAFGAPGAAGYVLETGLLLTWLFTVILVVSFAARQLPEEESRGTIFPLLAKPVTRLEMIVGKWLGACAVGAVATAAFTGLCAAAALLRGAAPDLAVLAQAALLHAGALAVLAAAAVALSTRLTGPAAATLTWLLAAASAFILPKVPRVAVHADRASATLLEALYYALPHLEFFDLRVRVVHGWGPAPGWAAAAALAYAACWSVALLAAGWLGYRRKFFRRGAA